MKKPPSKVVNLSLNTSDYKHDTVYWYIYSVLYILRKKNNIPKRFVFNINKSKEMSVMSPSDHILH